MKSKTFQQAIKIRYESPNTIYFIDKETQLIESTNKFKIEFNKFFREIDSVYGKLVFINEKEKLIRFGYKENLNFKYLFKLLSASLTVMYMNEADKHFKKCHLKNELLESIEEYDFDEIGFDEICIEGCPKLKQINWNIFGKQSRYIKIFHALNGLPNLTSIHNSEYDLFKLINSLANCEEIKIKTFHNELQSIKLSKLKRLTFCGSSIKITSIYDFAFYECDQIECIDLSRNDIKYISENAFHFRNENDKALEIHLLGNKLNESSFALNSLINFKRPTKLNLGYNHFKYLAEFTFKPFFDAHKWNQIVVDDYYDVNHERNRWNQNDKKYKEKIIYFNFNLLY